jgi:hypothetical protein
MKKRRMRIDVLFPFAITTLKWGGELRELAFQGLEELQALSGQIVLDVISCQSPVEVCVSEHPPRKLRKYWDEKQKHLLWEYRFVTLSTTVEIDVSAESRRAIPKKEGKEDTFTFPVSILIDDTAYDFEHKIRDLFLGLTIARPGIVHLDDGCLYINNKFHRSIGGISAASMKP